MKRFVIMMLAALTVLSLAACTPTQDRNKTGEVKETQRAMTADDKEPDYSAPEMTIVSIYSISDDGTSLVPHMEAIQEGDDEDTYPIEDTLLYQLEYYDVISEYAWVMEYDPGEEVDAPAGPGADSGEPTYTGAVLNLNCFSDDLDDEMVRKAIALTYMENLNADSITLQIDGDDVAAYTIDDIQ